MLRVNQLAGFAAGGPTPSSIAFQSITKSAPAQNHTLSGVNIGAADPTRRIVFGVITANSVAFRTVTVTVDGVSPTSHGSVQAAGFNGGRIELFSIVKPTGTTATFQINANGTNANVTLFVASVINEAVGPVVAQSDGALSGNQADLTIDIPLNGWLFAVSSMFGASTSPTGNTWTGVVEVSDDVVGTAVIRAGCGCETLPAAQTGRSVVCVVVGPTSSQLGCLIAMSGN